MTTPRRSVLLVLCFIAASARAAEPHRALVVAHRGLLRHAPENTLSNFRACLELRLGFEFDVRRTKDDVLVCVHDDAVDRTTDGTGKVSDLTLDEIRRLDAGTWFGPEFAGERVPTVEEILTLVGEHRGREILVAVDLKAENVAGEVVRLAEKHGALDRLLFIGTAISEPEVRRQVRAASREAHAAAVANTPDEFAAALAAPDADRVYFRFLPTEEQIREVRRAGKRSFLAGPTVAGNVPENWRRAAEAGVDAVLTDYPLELRAATRRNGDPLGPGDHARSVSVDGRRRTYLVHVPPGRDAAKPAPVVLAFHGAGMNGRSMRWVCGLDGKADEAGFVAVYPDGTGLGPFRTWNSGGFSGPGADLRPDDVKFTAALLDDLGTILNIDPKRVYATGLSNGGMMCHRLAAELSDRIAAVAPVAGTLAVDAVKPARPVPVLHVHGTADAIVPWRGSGSGVPGFLTFKSVEETVRVWCEADGCPTEPVVADEPDAVEDGTTVVRRTYGPGRGGSEVVLVTVRGGGHTWPGREPPLGIGGRSTRDISANDLIWAFFEKHPMP